MKVLVKILQSPQSVYNMTKIINEKIEFKVPIDDNDGDKGPPQDTSSYRVVYLTAGPLSKPAVMNRIRKLVRYGLIEEIKDEKKLPRKARFAFHQKRTKPFTITEYGLFCCLSYDTLTSLNVLRRYWHYKIMRLLLSPYFEKETVVGRLTTQEHRMISVFLHEELRILKQRLRIIDEHDELDIRIHEEVNKDRKGKRNKPWKEEQITQLKDELQWHAKSLALRLMVDSASRDKEKRQESRRMFNFLAKDKKFRKLTITTLRELQPYYRGARLL